MAGLARNILRSRLLAAAAASTMMAARALAADYPLEPPRTMTADPAEEKAWAQRYLDMEDWSLFGFINDAFWMLTSEDSPRNNYPIVQDWVRIEYARPYDPPNIVALSQLSLVEADCAKRQFRSLRLIGYRFNNLRGPVQSDFAYPDNEFLPAIPGSIGESLVAAVCDSAKLAAPETSAGAAP